MRLLFNRSGDTNFLVMQYRLCVIIPAYQVEQYIAELLNRTMAIAPELTIIIIDDGSTDRTSQILTQFPQIITIHHPEKQGKDKAIRTGMQAALQRGFTHAILMDADLQHVPECIPDFRETIETSDVDLVLGRRTFKFGVMPFHRILSNTITSLIISLRTNRRVHDSQCGYRLINLRKIEALKVQARGFQYESEVLIKALLQGYDYYEIPVPTVYNDSPSSIDNFWDTFRFVALIIRSYMW